MAGWTASPIDTTPMPSDEQARHDEAERLLSQLPDCTDSRERQELQDRVVVLTLDLADSAARRYRGRGVDAEDLTQVARMGLVKAVRGYRCGLGYSFAAYALPTMMGELKRYFRDYGWAVRPPRRLQEMRGRMAVEEESLRQALHREPTTRELASALNVRPCEVAEAKEAAVGYHTASIDGGPAGDSPVQVADSRDEYAVLLERDALQRALATLPPRDLLILRLRFVEERSQAEIGAVVGVSQMQVSRRLSAALARLRGLLAQAEAAA